MKKAVQGRFSIPDSNSLQGDFTGPAYKYRSDGALLLESQDEMKKRGMPSPTRAMQRALCFSEPIGSPVVSNANFHGVIQYPKMSV